MHKFIHSLNLETEKKKKIATFGNNYKPFLRLDSLLDLNPFFVR